MAFTDQYLFTDHDGIMSGFGFCLVLSLCS